jgi:hypothetical protein
MFSNLYLFDCKFVILSFNIQRAIANTRSTLVIVVEIDRTDEACFKEMKIYVNE